jgi:hypothetical protein
MDFIFSSTAVTSSQVSCAEEPETLSLDELSAAVSTSVDAT